MKYFYTKGLAYGWGFWGLFNTALLLLFFMGSKLDHYLINNLSNMGFFAFLCLCLVAVIFWIGPPMFIGYELSHVKPPPATRLERYYSVAKGIFVGAIAFCITNYAIMFAIEFATGWELL